MNRRWATLCTIALAACTPLNAGAHKSKADGGDNASPRADAGADARMPETAVDSGGHAGSGSGGSGGRASAGSDSAGRGGDGASGAAGMNPEPDAGGGQSGNGPDNSDAGPDAGPDSSMPAVAPCAADPAPCDGLQSCVDTSGAAVCGACPSGFSDAAPGLCKPVLLGLAIRKGVIEPAFDPNVFDYTLRLPFDEDRPGLQPSVAASIELTIGLSGATPDTVDSGAVWTAPDPLPFGTSTIAITLHAGSRSPVVYQLAVVRGGLTYIKASNTGGGDRFGTSIAVSGDTLVVGAPFESSDGQAVENTSGTSFSQANDDSTNSGAAYVFVLRNGHWQQQAYLKARNADSFDSFGASVAISGDRIVVGARGESSAAKGVNNTSPGEADNSAQSAGAAYVFVRSGDSWSQEAYLKASNTDEGDRFGTSVAIADDTIVVGAQYEKSASTGVNDPTPGENDNSAEFNGAAYVFVRGSNGWAQNAYLKASAISHGFGSAVAIDKDTIIVGASGDFALAGGAYIFARSANTWVSQAVIQGNQAEQAAGSSVAISGDVAVVGAPGDKTSINGPVLGAPSTYDTAKPYSGAALVLQRGGSFWGQIGYLKAPTSRENDNFGWSVAISGARIVIGSPGDQGSLKGANANPAPSDTAAANSGAGHVFLRGSGNDYSEIAYLKGAATHAGDRLGTGAAIAAATIVLGADSEGSASTGVDDTSPGPDDLNKLESGAAIVY